MNSAARSPRTLAIFTAIAIALVLAAVPAAAFKKAKTIPKSGSFTLDLLTAYAFHDNSPPGTAIAHPGLHSHAGGTGTFDDPITFAVTPQVQKIMKPGTKIYIPAPIQDYFIMEDDCTSSGPGGVPVQGDGCDGELKAGINEFDIWIGGSKSTSFSKEQSCESRVTLNNIKIVINPAKGMTVNTTPIFASNKCNR